MFHMRDQSWNDSFNHEEVLPIVSCLDTTDHQS